VIPCDIFAETVNILGKKFGHADALAAVEILLAGAVFAVEETDADVRAGALTLFGSLPEGVSYTDCVVMAMATANNTEHVFGFDDVFSKNGYQLPEARKEAA
jgi:predicted nucleic acid-binding protein